MNVKKTLLLVLLFFLMVGAVSAGDDNLTSTADDINVTYDEVMWKENLTDINVELPENASGDFCVKIDDEVIYNQTIENKSFKVPIRLPERNPQFVVNMYPPRDCNEYVVSAFYNNINLNLTAPLKVMTYPPDYNSLHFPEEILQHGSFYGLLLFPRSANGTVEFYIDDELLKTTVVMPVMYFEGNEFSNLALGNHTLRIHYLGDNYYREYNKTFNFTVVNVVIDIPDPVNIGHDDCILVETSPNVQGTVKVYIDNKMVYTSNTEDGEFLLSLEDYIKYTNREIKVVYTGKAFSRTKTQPINMTYDFDVWMEYFTYGEENVIEVILPDTLNRKLLTIKIDGVDYKFTQPEYSGNNMAEVDVSGLGVGNHSMFISFAGDDKFYPLNRTYNFTVSYDFDIPLDIEYKDSSKIYLRLPDNATGELEVYVDGKLFKAVKMNRGYAQVNIGALAPGWHDLTVRYDGTDYDVSEVESSLYVAPKISLTYRFRQWEDKYISVEVPKSCSGYAVFNIDGRSHKVQIKNGIAKYSLKNLKTGEHDILVSYYGNDGVKDLDNWRVVTVYKPIIKLTLQKVKVKKSAKRIVIKATLKLNGKVAKGKYLKFKFNKKTYKVKTNSRGIAKLVIKKSVLKKLKIGKKVKYQVSFSTKTVKRAVKIRK